MTHLISKFLIEKNALKCWSFEKFCCYYKTEWLKSLLFIYNWLQQLVGGAESVDKWRQKFSSISKLTV